VSATTDRAQDQQIRQREVTGRLIKTMVLTKYHRDEFPDTRRDFEAVHPPKREPFRSAYTGVAADVLPWLRAADTSWSALGMRRPDAPPAPPSRDLIEYQTAVSCAMHAHTVTMALAPIVALLEVAV
jgi:hypothetical protein